MPIQSSDFGVTALAIIGLAKLVQELHHRMIDGRGLREIEGHGLAARQRREILFQPHIIGEEDGAAELHMIDAGVGSRDFEAELQHFVPVDAAPEMKGEFGDDANRHADQ